MSKISRKDNAYTANEEGALPGVSTVEGLDVLTCASMQRFAACKHAIRCRIETSDITTATLRKPFCIRVAFGAQFFDGAQKIPVTLRLLVQVFAQRRDSRFCLVHTHKPMLLNVAEHSRNLAL